MKIGYTMYDRDGQKWHVCSEAPNGTVWLRGPNGQRAMYTRERFRQRPCEVKTPVRIVHSRQHLVDQYGEDVVTAAESTGMPVEYVARAWAVDRKAEWDEEVTE